MFNATIMENNKNNKKNDENPAEQPFVKCVCKIFHWTFATTTQALAAPAGLLVAMHTKCNAIDREYFP